MLDDVRVPAGTGTGVMVKAPVEGGCEVPVLAAERAVASPAVERDPTLVQRVERGGVQGAHRPEGHGEVGYPGGETRVRQETGDPDRALGAGKDPVNGLLIRVDVQLPPSDHLDDRRRAPAVCVLAGKRDPQSCWSVHRVSVAKGVDASEPAPRTRYREL